MYQFIEAVRLHPCLWNPVTPEYRDVYLKEDAWLQVVEQSNISVIKDATTAKLEWKKLRDNHRDALKRAKLGKNKLLPAQVTTWKYAKAMQFLEPHMKYRITEHIENEPSVAHDPGPDVSTTANVYNLKTKLVERPQKRRFAEEQSMDPLESFFNFMLQSTRAMPQSMQTQVKRNIFAVIMEAEEQINAHRSDQNDGIESPQHHQVQIKTEIYTDDD